MVHSVLFLISNGLKWILGIRDGQVGFKGVLKESDGTFIGNLCALMDLMDSGGIHICISRFQGK